MENSVTDWVDLFSWERGIHGKKVVVPPCEDAFTWRKEKTTMPRKNGRRKGGMVVVNEDEEDAKGEEDQGVIFLIPSRLPRQLHSYKRTFLNLRLGRTRERSYKCTFLLTFT